MNVAAELQKLHELHQSGAISDEEFAQAKARLLAEPTPAGDGSQGLFSGLTPATLEGQTRQWAMFVHLSQFAGLVVPLAGLVVPIVLWQIKKEELPGVDAHGKVVANWIISEIIYAILSAILVLVFVGILLLIVLGILGIVFPIIGGIKANNGEVWRYPFSITFFK